MKKEYKEAELEVIEIKKEDIITLSNNEGWIDTPGGN